MNGYELTDRLRKARRRHRLSAPTQALYYELVAICNEDQWPDEFKCSNYELCTALQVSEKSLIQYRQDLIQAGLLFYLSGKSKKKIGTYSFTKELYKGCIFYNQSDSLTGSQSVSQSGSQQVENASDYNKTKTESKLFVLVGRSEKTFDELKNLFEPDEGLRRKWFSMKFSEIEFNAGIEQWMSLHHGKEYEDFKRARDHFFFWIPNYTKIELNGKAKSITIAAKSNGTENSVKSLLSGADW